MPQATVYFFLNFIPSYVKPNPDVQNKIDIISAGDSVRNSLMTIIEQSAKRYSVSGAGKPTLTIRRSNQVKSLWNRGNQLILDANTPFTQDGFHLCPHLLNGIQIRAIWRQIERYCTFCSNQFAHKIAMMRSEIVHNDIVTLMNRR